MPGSGRVGAMRVIAILMVAFFATTACAVARPAPDNAPPSTPYKFTVRYELLGKGTATVKYRTLSGKTVERAVKLPWAKDVRFVDQDIVESLGLDAIANRRLSCRVIFESVVVDSQKSVPIGSTVDLYQTSCQGQI